MLASLGLFVFEMASLPFEDLGQRLDWKHAPAERVGVRNSSQFLGPGEDLVSIGGCIAPEAAGRFGAFTTLVEMADAGDTYQFVDGAGVVWGGYVIASLDRTRRYLLVDGTPRKVDFTLELRRVA